MSIYIGVLAGLLSVTSCNGCGSKDEHEQPKVESVILSRIKQKADLVTTEVRVRKLAIYDSSLHEKVELRDPRTWKYGERKCIVPVDVTIKYGYDLRDMSVDDVKLSDDSTAVVILLPEPKVIDLRDMSIDDVKLSDDSTAVVILLPEPKVIDSGYEAKVDEGAVVRMSSGLRDQISHEEVDRLMERTYKAVMKEDFSAMVNQDIENNAKVVFTGIVKSLGMENTDVMVQRKGTWRQ